MYQLIVENTLTGERLPVAQFNATGDLYIAMTALQSAAPKHLIYKITNTLAKTDTPIREWYISNYGDDELGNDILEENCFADLYKAISEEKDVYAVIGVNDSIIRERLFEGLTVVYNTSYDAIYKTWLHGK
jgi:hypothetical protein